jgi:Taurine catabolism dioxygenase TauD, TfdA family
MKVSKMPGFGSFGAIVEDFEWDQPEAYDELREINLNSLVTIVRGNGKNKFDTVKEHIKRVLTQRPNRLLLKYNIKQGQQHLLADLMSEEEKLAESIGSVWSLDRKDSPGWHRITGKVDDQGRELGAFGDTELLWHSNGFANLTFEPLVALYGIEGMSNTATCYQQSVDWYDKQTDSFKSELNDLVSICQWDKSHIMPSGNDRYEAAMKHNFVPEKNARIPLVVDSVGGFRGLHYSKFIVGFEGMSKQDSDNLIAKLDKELFDPQYQYDGWWQNDTGELTLFEQCVTLHMRKIKNGLDLKSTLSDRLAYRVHADYTGHTDYNGFLQEEFRNQRYEKLISKLNRINNVQ